MTQTEIQGNKLIAEFMQEPYIKDKSIGMVLTSAMCRTNPEGLIYEEMKYHSSWDWLIPACKKFDNLNILNERKEMAYNYVRFCNNIDDTVSCYDILPTWEALIEAIIWYNKYKTENPINK